MQNESQGGRERERDKSMGLKKYIIVNCVHRIVVQKIKKQPSGLGERERERKGGGSGMVQSSKVTNTRRARLKI